MYVPAAYEGGVQDIEQLKKINQTKGRNTCAGMTRIDKGSDLKLLSDSSLRPTFCVLRLKVYGVTYCNGCIIPYLIRGWLTQ